MESITYALDGIVFLCYIRFTDDLFLHWTRTNGTAFE